MKKYQSYTEVHLLQTHPALWTCQIPLGTHSGRSLAQIQQKYHYNSVSLFMKIFKVKIHYFTVKWPKRNFSGTFHAIGINCNCQRNFWQVVMCVVVVVLHKMRVISRVWIFYLPMCKSGYKLFKPPTIAEGAGQSWIMIWYFCNKFQIFYSIKYNCKMFLNWVVWNLNS